MAMPIETKVAMNVPHILIGGVAILTGYLLAKRPAEQPAAA
jgi:hypothetical protein